MDMQKSAASRVRHILAAMERSIDSARSRRTDLPSSAPAPTPAGLGGANAGENIANAMRSSSAQGQMIGHPRMSPQPGAYAGDARPNPLIGGSTVIGGQPPVARLPSPPVDPNAPARIKAKPKRFESTFAAQFAQNNYRSQAG